MYYLARGYEHEANLRPGPRVAAGRA
jgi:hypothetical protein